MEIKRGLRGSRRFPSSLQLKYCRRSEEGSGRWKVSCPIGTFSSPKSKSKSSSSSHFAAVAYGDGMLCLT